MTLKQRYAGVIDTFREIMPTAETELHYRNPFELLVAVILSAQCTDKRVNMVTPALFEAYPTPGAMAAAEPEQLLPYISSITFPNNKSRHLSNLARKLTAEFDGRIPSDIDTLTTLPGVGRKTANVMLAVVWGKAAMPVDTHVFRVSGRLGLTTGSKTPLSTERTLTRHIPGELLPLAHHWLILHGRYVCKARKPLCSECRLTQWCRMYQKANG